VTSATAPPAANVPQIVIAPRRSYALQLRELWAYRELFYFLMWRDVKVRYKQTAIGSGWAIIQPVLLMVVFTIFIGQLRGVGPTGIPYPIFSFAALVPWTFFSSALGAAANSLVGNSNLISKVYLPRVLLTLAAACSFVLDFVISFAVLVLLMFGYSYAPSTHVYLLPLFALYVIAVACGSGCLLAAINVKYRDVRYAIPFLIQLWLFATPVAYQFSVVGSQYRYVFALNPMVTGVEGFRSSIVGGPGVPFSIAAISAVSAFVIVVLGLFYFRRVERTMADVI
jgi:lipopolysaccharide transport system permease protein